MLAPLERSGVADRAAFVVGLHRDLISPLQGDAGRFLHLKDHRVEAMVIVVVKDDVPGEIGFCLFVRFGLNVGSFEGLRAHIMTEARSGSLPIRSAVSSR